MPQLFEPMSAPLLTASCASVSSLGNGLASLASSSKSALDEQVGPRGDAQAIEAPEFRVGFARGRVAGGNAGAVRAVAVTVRAIR